MGENYRKKGGKLEMLVCDGITKSFDAFTAVEDVSFTVEDGSICGLVGYNGAGKTTLLKIAASIYRPDKGGFLFDGKLSTGEEKTRQEIFLLPDVFYYLPQATLRSMAAFYSGYYPTWSVDTYHKLLELFDLEEKTRIQRFSKGMQRQAYLAIALACQPHYLLLDETFDGLDPSKRNLVRRILMEYIAEKEACVLLASHNLPELENLCDHIVILNEKKVAFDCSMDDIGRDIRKYRLVFRQPVKEEQFHGLDYRRFSQDGGVISLMIRGDEETAEAALRALEPVLLESFPLSLEEVFLYEMEEKRYDLTGLF